MLSTRGIPTTREGGEKNNHPSISWYKESKEGNYLFTFIVIGTHKKAGICCKTDYVYIYCTLCDLQVNIDIQEYIDDNDPINEIVCRVHSHDDLQNKLIHILPREDGQFGEQYLGSATNEGNFASPKDIRCGICNKNIIGRRHGHVVKMVNCVNDLNRHYRSDCTISKQCQAKEDLSFNRNEEIQAIYNAVKEYIDNFAVPILRPRSPDYVDDFVKIVGRCSCGRSNILQCKVCKTEWKGSKLDPFQYGVIIRRHFGKKTVLCTFEDFVYSTETNRGKEQHKLDRLTTSRFNNDRQYRCVICGEDYGDTDNGALPPKEIVIDHFKQCLEANSHKFAAGGYSCAH